MKRVSPVFASLFVFALLSQMAVPVFACGPFTVDPIFKFTRHPDYPLMKYADGKIGVVPGSYGRMSLFVFYRQLNGMPLTQKEQRQFKSALEDRIGVYTPDGAEPAKNSNEDGKDVGYNKWNELRKKMLGTDAGISAEKQIESSYSYFTNCLDDAFANAANTFESRIASYGDNADTRAWLTAQDDVFSNCGENKKVPSAADGSAPAWLKKDRAYQIAAAQFYRGEFAAARNSFQEIVNDKDSPWSKTARFLIARTYIRESSLIEAENDEQKKKEKSQLLEKALTELKAITSDSSMSEFHGSAERLLGMVNFRLNPMGQKDELAARLTKSGENKNFRNDLIDYIWLLDKVESIASDAGQEAERKAAEAQNKSYDYNYSLRIQDVPAKERAADLTDWLFTYQVDDGFDHAAAKWKETKRIAWFVAAISKATAKSPQTAELMSEASKIKSDSPAYATASYHLTRLLIESGKRAEAKAKLGEVMGNNFSAYPISTQNEFFSLRMAVAENLEDFLKYAQRKPAAFVWSDDANEGGDDLKDDKALAPWKERAMFDNDAVAFLNEKAPLSVLREAALSKNIPEHLRKFLVISVWTRAFILGNSQIEREFAPLVDKHAKEFAPYFSKYTAAANPLNREAAGLLTILRYPVMQPYLAVGIGRETSDPAAIDSIRGNWWCGETELKDGRKYSSNGYAYPAFYPEFLNETQKTNARAELAKMNLMGASATLLTKRTLDFATKNPRHALTPELLHLAVRSTRYGCSDNQTLGVSKSAFNFLHKRFPGNPWTKKTPYYFGQKGE